MAALPQPTSIPQKIVICGAGLHGSSLAYYLTKAGHRDVTVIERHSVAAAASGKGGGFLARDWGAGPTDALHKVSFALHEQLASELGINSYRRIPVLSVQPGKRTARTNDLCPWLDGDISQSSMMDADGGAQVDPYELCTKLMAAAQRQGAKLVVGQVTGVAKTENRDEGEGVKEEVCGVELAGGSVIECDACVVCMGPWSSLAQDWFGLPVPITGIKSTSVVFKSEEEIEPFALFCGEDDDHGTHLEVYPRNSGEVYLCGIGGSEYVTPERLRAGEYPPGQVPPDPSRVKAATLSFGAMSRKLTTASSSAGGVEKRAEKGPAVVQACMRPCAPDAMPLMGKVGHLKGAYLSAGHNCWGILWAPVSGKSMSELILKGSSECVELSAFSPNRFMPDYRGQGRGRKKGALAVGEQW